MIRESISLDRVLVPQAILCVGTTRLCPVLLGDKPFERADGDCAVDRAATARVFARRGADAAANRRERIGGARNEKRLFVAPVGDQLDVASGIGAHRTRGLALHLCGPLS